MNNLIEIQNIIKEYFDALYYGDIEGFKKIMHPSSHLYCSTDDEFIYLNLDEYLNLVEDRPSPSIRKDPRYDQILSIDITSRTTARVSVNSAYLPKKFIDELTLVKVKNNWLIVNKVYHYEI